MDKAILNWAKSAEYDLLTAQAMLNTKRYIYVIFFCHLAVEKLLKALTQETTGKIPPKTHDLSVLVKLSGILVPKEHASLLARLNSVSIPTRYPEDIAKITRQYTQAVTTRYLKETKLLHTWLKRKLTK
jgi:HEPN domain-containing protein